MFDEEKINLAKQMFKSVKKSNKKYTIVFNILKDDLLKLKKIGMSYQNITDLLSKELKTGIKIQTLATWFRRNKKENAKDVKHIKEKKAVKEEVKKSSNIEFVAAEKSEDEEALEELEKLNNAKLFNNPFNKKN